jgi:hypothetical protein
LSIGLAGISTLRADAWMARLDDRARVEIAELARYAPLRAEHESFWLSSRNRSTAPWVEHEDINDVMLATSLVPDGFLGLTPPAGPQRRAFASA